MKSNKNKLTEYSISSCNNPSKANSFAAEEDKDSTTRKHTDLSSTIPKEHGPDLKTSDSYNVKKEHKENYIETSLKLDYHTK